MTTSINGMSVDIPVPVQTARASAAVVTTTGVNDLAAIARQQLQSAVPAPALLAAYSSKIAPQTKPAPRGSVPQPSSQLAAQIIAQDASLSSDDLTIFEPRPLPDSDAPEPIAGRYLAAAATANENAQSATIKPTVSGNSAQVEEATVAQTQQQASVNEALAHAAIQPALGQFAAVLPSFFSKFLRRQSIVQAYGAEAYALAASRNAVNLAKSNTAPAGL